MTRLLIAASGTGGHIFPALTIAEALDDTWEINWLGVPDRLEKEVVPKKYPMITIQVSGLKAGFIRSFFYVLKLLFSTFQVINLIKRRKIKIVFTTGGYIAAPAILASKICGIKVILHESNAFPGKVTRFLGRFCDEVALGFPIAKKYLNNCRTVVTGTPVRSSFFVRKALPCWVPEGVDPLIVVIGGSQGAVGLNYMFREVAPWLLKQGCRIVHITGSNDESSVIGDHRFVERNFIDDISPLLQNADLVISRAGAGTLSELAICNCPAILVPYPYAADNHQEFNALYAAQFGAAVLIHQSKSCTIGLRKILKMLLDSYSSSSRNSQSDDLITNMRKGMDQIAIRDAHLNLVDIIKKYTS